MRELIIPAPRLRYDCALPGCLVYARYWAGYSRDEMGKRIGNVGQQNIVGSSLHILQHGFSTCETLLFLRQASETIARFQDGWYTPATGLDIVATKWESI